MCVKLVIYKDCNKMHGQQNINTDLLIPNLYLKKPNLDIEQCQQYEHKSRKTFKKFVIYFLAYYW